MPIKVVDASAVGALLFGEPEGAGMVGRLQDNQLVAPTLLPFELVSICMKKLKRYPEQHDALLEALRLFARMAIEHVPVDLPGVAGLAEITGLTAYDASYLWLAQKLGAELVTLDRELSSAAKF